LIFSYTIGISQTVFPTQQWFGSPSTLTTFKGAGKADYGFIHGRYTDTTSANAIGYIQYYAGAMIVTGDTLWLRNSTATEWLIANGSGGGGGSGSWGSITGTLSNQTDLQNALNLKANLASPTFTGTVTFPIPFTLGATSVLTSGDELNFVDGVTSNIQTQLNSKQDIVTASQGLIKSGNDLQFGGTSGSPATISGFRYLDVGTNGVYFFNNDAAPAGSYPFSIYIIDSATSNNMSSADLPVAAFGSRRTIRMTGPYQNSYRLGSVASLTFEVGDSAINRTDGGDFGGGLWSNLGIGFLPSKTTGRSVITMGHGGSGYGDNEAGFAMLGNVSFNGSNGSRYSYVRGWINGVSSYITMQGTGTDTLQHFNHYGGGNFIDGGGVILNEYWVHPGVMNADTMWFLHDDRNYNSYLEGNIKIGGTDTELPVEKLEVTGTPRFITGNEGSGKVWTSDANGVGDWETGGGGGSGLFPTTGTGTATGNVIGDLDGNILEIQQGGNNLFQINPVSFEFELASDDGNAKSSVFVSADLVGNNVLFRIEADDDTNQIGIEGDAQDNSIEYTAGAHTFNGTVILSDLIPSGAGFIAINASGELVWSSGGSGSGDALTADPLSQFAATTSAQFAGVISDESGTGLVILQTLPSILTPNITSATFAAGTATAGTAPIYLTSGTNLTVPVSGAIEFGGNVFYQTTASGRGLSTSTMYAVLDQDFTLADVNTAQTMFPSTMDVWTLASNTTYEFETMIDITCGTTSHSVGFGFDLGTATVTSINYTSQGYNSVANNLNTAQTFSWRTATSTVSNMTPAATTAGNHIFIKGIIKVNTGGTLTPQIQFSTAPGGTNLMKENSYIKFTPLGTGTMTTVGSVN
jgi:hypothetical protein